MTQYNTLNVKLSSSQLNKLKSEIKNGTEDTLNLSSGVTGNSNDESNFPQITNRLVSRHSQTFTNSSSANMKLSKSHLYKIGQLGGFPGRPLGPLLKNGLSLMKNVFKSLA